MGSSVLFMLYLTGMLRVSHLMPITLATNCPGIGEGTLPVVSIVSSAPPARTVITFDSARQRQRPKLNIFFSMFFIFSPSIFRHRTIYRRVYGQWLLIEVAHHQSLELRQRDGLKIAPNRAGPLLYWRPGHIAHDDVIAVGGLVDRKLALREANHRVAVGNPFLAVEEEKGVFTERELWRAGVGHGELKLPSVADAAGCLDNQRSSWVALERLRDCDRRICNQAALDPPALGSGACADDNRRRFLRHLLH